METKTIFRTCLILSVVMPLLGIAITELTIYDQTQEMQNLYAWDGYGGIFWEDDTAESLAFVNAMIFLLVISVASFIGLLLFKKWARTLTVCLTIITIGLNHPMGVFVSFPIQTMLNTLADILFGVVLCLAYTEPLKYEFEKMN